MKTITNTHTIERSRASATKTVGRLFFLEASGGRIHSANADGSDRKVIVTGCRIPDGIVVDVEAGHIYWTNMGVPSRNDGSIERADLDGKNRITIIRRRRDIHAEAAPSRKGERQTLLVRSRGNARDAREPRWFENRDSGRYQQRRRAARHRSKRNGASGSPSIRIAGKYIGRKKGRIMPGKGRIFRANIDIPKGETPANRTDIEVLFDGLPEPIDLELDLKNRLIYWTDRGDPPRGNTVNRASMDADSENAGA